MGDPDDTVLAELLDRCRRDHRSWIVGDAGPYALPEDGSILGAVGGSACGGDETTERQLAVARRWSDGEESIDYLNGGRSDDLAWLTFVERSTTRIDDGPFRRWDLRVTEVFRRSGDGWQRVHRHADPLVDRHELIELAALLDPSG